MNELVSVVVPVYKVEPYLNQCIESIINQTYGNFELILVDDGSPDNCGQICDQWAARDSRIVVVHKENGGLSDARNCGMQHATGSILSFVDSDDCVDRQFLELMLDQMYLQGCDVVECYPVTFKDGESPCANYNSLVKVQSPKQWLTESNLGSFISCIVCNKLFRKHVFDGISFPVGCLYEDEATTYKVVFHANKVVRIGSGLYFYRQREGSIVRTAKSIRSVDFQFQALHEKCLYFDEINERDIADFSYAKLAICMVSNYYFRKKSIGKSKDWYCFIRNVFFRIAGSGIVPMKYKIYLAAFLLCPVLFK